VSKKISTPSGGGARDWAAYSAAQMNEKSLFLWILSELCRAIEDLAYMTGRRPLRLRDMIFCLVFKVYSMKSARRFTDDLREIQAKGLIETVPSPTSLGEYMCSEAIHKVLRHLLVQSSLPLSEAESVFAVDSTGLTLPRRRVWFNKHTNRRERRRDYMKLHAMIGVKTNIITYAETSEGTASDMTYLKHLVAGTARYFNISEVSADAGYLSGENFYTVLLHGGIPYIAFRKNNALDADYKSTFWKDMLYLWKTKHPVFTEHYFLRNNVEAAFHAMKAKFGGRLHSKSTAGQFSEALAKALCHNICVLIRSMYELHIDPLAWSEKAPRPLAEGLPLPEAVAHRKDDLLAIRNAAGDRQLPEHAETPRRSLRARKPKGSNSTSGQVSLFD
jgi:transposase